MNVITCRHYEELSEKAAAIIAETVKQKPDAVLGLATGGTPEGVYKELVRMHRSEGLSFRNVTTINLDEYAGLSPEDKNSYHYYMNTHFLHISTAERTATFSLTDGQTILMPNAGAMTD